METIVFALTIGQFILTIIIKIRFNNNINSNINITLLLSLQIYINKYKYHFGTNQNHLLTHRAKLTYWKIASHKKKK